MKFMPKLTQTLTIIFILFTTVILRAQSQAFLEEGGLLVIEIESIEQVPDGWAEETSFSGYTGDFYFRYNDSNHLGTPGIDLLEYPIYIQNPGLYRFRWRSLIAEGTSTTDANDSWLKILADAFYGLQGSSSIVCPKGYDSFFNDCPIGLDGDANVTPAGSGSDGWFKIYRSGRGDWVWSTQTSDSDAHQIYARFDKTGLYTIQVSGRSKNHAIDRMVMYRADYNGDPLDTNLPESLFVEVDLIFANGFGS